MKTINQNDNTLQVEKKGLVSDPYLPHEAEVIERIEEGPNIFTLRLRFSDPAIQRAYYFAPGQFNMLYLYGVGEVPISIVSDPKDDSLYDHTIRVVGRVTAGLNQLKAGDTLGIRGPYGRGWPLDVATGKDVVIVTGGLGCAPLVAMVNYILKRRDSFGHLSLMQGVKHSNDLIFKERFAKLQGVPDVTVYVAADKRDQHWAWYEGRVTDFIPKLDLTPENTICFMCGPEMMMKVAIKLLQERDIADEHIYLNMERSMKCAIGHCGHCQYGGHFICKDGPVFAYPEVKHLLGKEGF